MATVLQIVGDTSFVGLSEISVRNEEVVTDDTGSFDSLIVGDQPGLLVDSTFAGASEVYDPPNTRNVTVISSLQATDLLSISRKVSLTAVAELGEDLISSSLSSLVGNLTATSEVTGQSDRNLSILSELVTSSSISSTKLVELVASLEAESSISASSLVEETLTAALETSLTDVFSSTVRNVLLVSPLTAESLLFQGGSSTFNVALVDTLIATSDLVARDLDATAWVLNTESGAVSRYSDFDFNSLASNGGLLFGASADGLYVIAGDKDEDRDVNTDVTTGFMDLGSDMRKRVSDVYFGYTGGQMKATVEAYNGPTDNYTFEDRFREGDAPRNNRIKTGRGLTSRYWRISMKNISGDDFKLQDVTLNVAESRRRL